jgi:hypothetical protein
MCQVGLHLNEIGEDNLANIAGFANNQRFRGGQAVIQLGWGVRLAHCSTTILGAVKLAHLNHLYTLEDITPLRNPLYRSNRAPPFRIAKFSRENSNIKVGEHTTTGHLWTAQHGIQGFFPQHFTSRRSLAILGDIFEGVKTYRPLPADLPLF